MALQAETQLRHWINATGSYLEGRLKPGSVRSVLILGLIVLLIHEIPGLNLISKPFRTFDFFIHELGHALACLVTGGKVNWMKLSCGGVTDCVSGNQVAVVAAGYIVQAIIGALLIVASRHKRLCNKLLLVLGVGIGLANLFFLRDRAGITWGFIVGATLALTGFSAPAVWAQLLVLAMAVQTAFYVFGDVELVLEHSLGLVPEIPVSDATHAAKITGIEAPVWAIGWSAFSVLSLSAAILVNHWLDRKERTAALNQVDTQEAALKEAKTEAPDSDHEV